MITHSSVLVWRIPWTGEPGGLQFIGSHRVRHDWSDLAHTHRVPKIVIGTYMPTSFYCTSLCFRYCIFFLQTEGLWQPSIQQVFQCHFSRRICLVPASVSHFDHSCNISNFFIIIVFVMVICDHWSLMLILWLFWGHQELADIRQ